MEAPCKSDKRAMLDVRLLANTSFVHERSKTPYGEHKVSMCTCGAIARGCVELQLAEKGKRASDRAS